MTQRSWLEKFSGLHPAAILTVLLLLGTFIRFYGLTHSGLWLDEIFSMIGADPNTTVADVYEYSKRDQPPFFFITLHSWFKLAGYTDFTGRSLTCIFGVLGILAMYFLGKEFQNENVGLFAAFITTINWFHVDISKEIRFYPLVFLLTSLSFLFFLRSIKYVRVVDFLVYAICTALLLNTHYYAMVVFVSQMLIFVLVIALYKRSVVLIIGGILSGGLTGLSLLHWLPIIQQDIQTTQFHVKPVEWTIVFDFAWSYIKDPVAFALYTICVFFTLRAIYRSAKAKQVTVEQAVLIGWILFGFGIPLLYSLLRMPLLTHKYNTITVPAILLIIANGFAYFTNRKVLTYGLIAIIISGFIILFFARPPYKPRRWEDWREVATYFKTNVHPDSLASFSQVAWFHGYYFKKQNLPHPVDQTYVDVPSMIKNRNEIWLLLNDWYSGGDFLEQQKTVIDREFDAIDTVSFKQTKAVRYRRKNQGTEY